MRRILSLIIGLFFCGLLATATRGETYQLTDGTSVTGSIVSSDDNGLTLRQDDGSYSPRVPWVKFSQDDLKKLQANPKIAPFVEFLIEEPPPEKGKTAGVVIQPVTRLDRPSKLTLLGAMFSSSVGVAVLLLLYAANIYAGYEVSIFRAKPPALVCGVSAIAPVVGPIIFLCMSTPAKEPEKVAQEVVAAHAQRFAVTEEEPGPGEPPPSGLHIAHSVYPPPEGGGIPAPQIFTRGEFTFNRRFIETKFAGYFGVVRVGSDRDMVLLFKTARGEFVVQRITRITGAELHLQAQNGSEVMVPFNEIKEIQLKHKDA